MTPVDAFVYFLTSPSLMAGFGWVAGIFTGIMIGRRMSTMAIERERDIARDDLDAIKHTIEIVGVKEKP